MARSPSHNRQWRDNQLVLERHQRQRWRRGQRGRLKDETPAPPAMMDEDAAVDIGQEESFRVHKVQLSLD